MSIVVIPLKDFVFDPEKKIDLLAMPQEEAVALIKKSFSFLSSAIQVSIRDGVASITLPEAQAQRVDDALRSIDRAEKHAKEGDYKRAIQLFQRALEVIPAHTDARRSLAMSYLEMGDKEKAKDLLVQVLALDPKDEWAYVLLGNIYSKHENKSEVAEKFYRRAYELNPRDAILLTNYGALMVEKGNREQATEFFERAIEAHPTYPNPYYALALLYLQDDKPNRALPYLEDLFAKSKPGDVRADPLYDEARKLYLETNKRVAEKSYDHLMKWVEEHKQALKERTGYRVQIREDNSLEGVFAVTQMAWKYGRDYHWVRYRDMGRAVNPHHLVHEMEHILLEHQAREQGRNRIFISTKQNRERGIRVISDWIYKMRDKGFPEKDLTDVVIKLVDGLTNQIFNCPLDMIIEYRAHQNYPVIHNSQFVALGAAFAQGLTSLTSTEIRRLTPPHIYKASNALNCAYALFIDSLYNGKTEYARAYQTSDVFVTGQTLFALWQSAMRDFKPGDEYTLVDEFARVLKLEGWFDWKTDDGTGEIVGEPFVGESGDTSPQGPTNPELLKAKQPATVLFLLDAIQRFEKMTDEQVKQIGFEIGTRGMEGIDYASTERTYTLKAFLGENFSGLQMLCLMYVAFQRIDPTVNIGVDFKDAYAQALKMYDSKSDDGG